MERKLIKAVVYSFSLALLVAIIYFPDTQTSLTGNGLYTSRVLSLREYLFKILRFSIKIALITLIITWVWELKKAPEADGTRFTKGLLKSFLLAFVLGAGILMIIAMNYQ